MIVNVGQERLVITDDWSITLYVCILIYLFRRPLVKVGLQVLLITLDYA